VTPARPESATIRTARAEDAGAVLSLAQPFATSFAVDPQAFHRAYPELLSSTDARLLVAETGDRIVGYLLGFDHLTFFANGRVAWVEEITVEASLRRRRIGALLMQAFEAWARSRSCRLVGLATRRAAEFYRALGYEDSATYYRKLL
jgi:GNAT superfamily N-acetyltransferase